MSDIKLFTLNSEGAQELSGSSASLEKELQHLVEANLEVLLGARFLATEYNTGNSHKGRIDSLGLDENNCPVIIEYKRDKSSTVINQGLFYLDWLQKNRSDFKWLVMEKIGREIAEEIEWNGARLLCVAGDFPKYDIHAVEQINANIELIRYRYFGEQLLLLELVNTQTANNSSALKQTDDVDPVLVPLDSEKIIPEARKDNHESRKQQATAEHIALYDGICEFVFSLGDEVQRKELKFYTAFKLIKNFASVLLWAPIREPSVKLYLKLNPDNVKLEQGFSADVRDKGHWGTGDLELIVRNHADFEKAKRLITASYEQS